MRRIIYLCPTDDAPTGGVKIIYRHSIALCALGADAYVLHPFNPKFHCTWFDAKVRLLDTPELDPQSDFVMIPELWACQFAGQCGDNGIRYGIFVQNGYMTTPLFTEGQTRQAITEAFDRASVIAVISDDTAEMVKLNYPSIDPKRIVRVRYSIDPRFLAATSAQATKSSTVTYMPRKLPDHAWRVVFALGGNLPQGWRIQRIDGVDEATCAAMLCASRIFLAFSNFEGLPLPPVEAAMAGNFVVGYTGQGAQEYWNAPNFQEIHQGDVIGFVKAASQAARKIDAGELALPNLLQGVAKLSEQFSPAAELESLKSLLKRVNECFA